MVWCTLSLVALLLVAAPLAVPEPEIARWIPPCEAKLRGASCIACGLTTGFYAIAGGDIRRAAEANRAAPWLFAGFAVNSLLFCGWLAGCWIARRRADVPELSGWNSSCKRRLDPCKP
jgi:hypothetical protein